MLGLLKQPFPVTRDQGHMTIPSLPVHCYCFQELCELTFQTTCTLVFVVMPAGTSQGILNSVLELRTLSSTINNWKTPEKP